MKVDRGDDGDDKVVVVVMAMGGVAMEKGRKAGCKWWKRSKESKEREKGGDERNTQKWATGRE